MPEEFYCVECGRHIVRFHNSWDVKLCVECVYIPGWFQDPKLCAIFDPSYKLHTKREE